MIKTNAVIEFFEAVLKADSKLLKQISSSSADIEMQDGELVFSLVGLHQFLQSNLLATNQIDKFDDFKKMLYTSELNQDLQALGARVVVAHSSGKIATNSYRLATSF